MITLIILYLVIGLTVGTILYWKEFGSYGFENTIDNMEISDFWLIFIITLTWPIIAVGIGLPVLFRFVILSVIKLIKDGKRRDDNTN